MTEQELCAWFQGVAERHGFTVYNEWAGFDQLLVGEDGTQVGVEAKLRANVDVLAQAIAGWRQRGRTDRYGLRSPQHRAALVKKASPSFRDLANALGVLVVVRFESRKVYEGAVRVRRDVEHPRPLEQLVAPASTRFRWGDGVALPEVVPDVVGGAPAPVRLTPWKLKAIKLCLRLREKGYVTVADFREFDVDPSRWRNHWLEPNGRIGRATKWVPKTGVELPDEQHPEVAAKLREAS